MALRLECRVSLGRSIMHKYTHLHMYVYKFEGGRSFQDAALQGSDFGVRFRVEGLGLGL